MDTALFLGLAIAWVLVAMVFGLLGLWVAIQKGRSGAEGATLGMLLGIIGVVIEALLPSQIDDAPIHYSEEMPPKQARQYAVRPSARQASRRRPPRIGPS